ncbi:SdrH family protein [Staphylococcus aureus]|uniref:SdrH family protein n=1 Tax=Staphylococcus aureus TaxID=1280 RepID=UPI002223256F|nr:SdrH family protein [Staphylococcus aureus]MCW1282068.1 SdrH family protein [Staphylococcus aureus]
MSYHWFKKMLLSTSMLILSSSSSLGLATHTVEAKDNLNGEKPTTNLNHNVTSPSVNSEMNNNETGTPHESNQAGNEGTGSNSRDANPDSNNVKPDPNKPNPNPSPNPNQPGDSNQSGGSKNGGTWNPNASDGSNQGQWQPNGNQGNSQNPTGNDFVSQRFLALANGAYKYNPYILNQINQLGKEYGEVTDEDIYNIIRKQNFSGNAYLNGLQQQSNYFRFQYFNPLKSERYYRNLDEQVLALITGEIGSMPDLKKPEDKPDSKQRSFEPHEKDDFTVVKKQEDNKKSASTAYSKSWLAIVCSMMVVFSIMLFLFVKRNKKKNKNESQRR